MGRRRGEDEQDEQQPSYEYDYPPARPWAPAWLILVAIVGSISFFALLIMTAWLVAHGPPGSVATGPAVDETASGNRSASRQHGDNATSRPKIGNQVEHGDLLITLPYVVSGKIRGTRYGEISNYRGMWVLVKIENRSRTKMYRLAGWRGRGKCEDEHGNVYEAMNFPSGFGFNAIPCRPGKVPETDVPGDAILAGETRLNPKSKQASFIFFESPADVATEARLTLPAIVEGEKGGFRFRVPISRVPDF